MQKQVRPPFDIRKDFYVVKPFRFNGVQYTPFHPKTGKPMLFPWRRIACSARDVYRYWELRWLECKSEENIAGVNFLDEKPEPEKVKEVVIPKKVSRKDEDESENEKE